MPFAPNPWMSPDQPSLLNRNLKQVYFPEVESCSARVAVAFWDLTELSHYVLPPCEFAYVLDLADRLQKSSLMVIATPLLHRQQSKPGSQRSSRIRAREDVLLLSNCSNSLPSNQSFMQFHRSVTIL